MQLEGVCEDYFNENYYGRIIFRMFISCAIFDLKMKAVRVGLDGAAKPAN